MIAAKGSKSHLLLIAVTIPRFPTRYNLFAMKLEEKLQELQRRSTLAEEGGGIARLEKQRKDGKMTARERIEFLLDEGTFEETDKLVTHQCSDFGMQDNKIYGDGLSPATGRLMGGRFSFSRRISRCLVGRFLGRTRRRL